jgi:hypothetical protein
LIKDGALFPTIAKFGQKYYFFKKTLQEGGNLLGNFFIPICEDWSKTNKSNFLQFTQIGTKLIKVISSNSHRLGQN